MCLDTGRPAGRVDSWQTGVMEEIVVAKSSIGLAIGGVVGTALILSIVVVFFPFFIQVFLIGVAVVLAVLFVSRFAAMKLSVSRSAVHVVNFSSSYELDLATVRIADEVDSRRWPEDNVGQALADDLAEPETQPARVLYLTDGSGAHVRVGVAPSYGSRLDAIAEDLYVAIDTMRSRG